VPKNIKIDWFDKVITETKKANCFFETQCKNKLKLLHVNVPVCVTWRMQRVTGKLQNVSQ